MPTLTNEMTERLLTRLGEYWHTMRSGSPGFYWTKVRAAMSHPKVTQYLDAAEGWAPDAGDRELYGAFVQAIRNDRWKDDDFDSWDGGPSASQPRGSAQQAGARKKAASVARKKNARATTPAPAASKANTAPAATDQGWPKVTMAPFTPSEWQ